MRVRKKLGVCYVLMVLLTIAIVIPIIWLVFISMKPNSEIMNNPLSLPNALDFGNYVSALQTLDLFTLYKNTAFIAVCSLAVEIVITFSSAVGLTRLYYRSDGVRSGLQGFLQLGLAVSPFILLFPIYKINKFLGFSQQLSLILPYIATSISFNTLLFTAYLRTVPKELDEAALMDGVSLWQLMTKILVPIAKPVLATVIIFNLLYIWNEYPFASIMIEKPAYYTISRGIAAFQGQYNIDYGGLAAYSVMVLLPELVFYGIFQRHVVDGMTVGAVKGGQPLTGATYTILPDRIETATFLCACAACGGTLTLRRTAPRLAEPVLNSLTESGCRFSCTHDTIQISRDGPLMACRPVISKPYPGFPTDAMPVLLASQLRAEGQTDFTETIFENRFGYARELKKLGAQLRQDENTVHLRGAPQLYAAQLFAEDLRGGAALVLAAMQAEGESTIFGVKHIERGYDTLEAALQSVGARLKTVEIPKKM